MTRHQYKYSSTKFWLLIAACSSIFITSVGFQAVSIRAYERRERQEFAHAVDMLLTETARSLLERTRSDLVLLADSTVNKLSLLRFESQPLTRWMDAVMTHFLDQRPSVIALAVYGATGQRLIAYGTLTPCLPDVQQPNAFCAVNRQLAYRINVPLAITTAAPRGWLSAIVILSPDFLRRIEQEYRLNVTILRGLTPLYAPNDTLTIDLAPHAIIDAELQHQLTPRPPSRLWQHGLWYAYVVHLGDSSDRYTVRLLRNGDFLLWKIGEAVLMNAILLFLLLTLFSYFHINYKYISHVYRAMFDGMIDWVCFKDTGGAYQLINRAMSFTLFDRHPREVIGKRDADLLRSDFAQQCAVSDQEVILSRHPLHLTEAGQTATGNTVVMDVWKTPLFHENGAFGGVVICARDISEQMHLQATLDALEESYFSSEWILSKLFQTMPEFLYVKDRDHRFVRASFSVCEFYGLADVTGLTDFDMMPAEDAQKFWDDENRLLTGLMESYTQQENVTTPDGRRRHVLSTKTIFRDKRGRIAGLLGIGRDMTELMDKQTALEYVIAQITQQTLQEVRARKQKTEPLEVEESHAAA